MIALKPIFHPFIHPINTATCTLTTRLRNTSSIVCKSNDSSSSSDSQKPEGDIQSQEMLAQIAMLQTQKVRLTDFLDERSDYLTKFGEEAKAEFDKVGEDALKELDEASDSITAKIESQMLAFEESTEQSKLEIEETDNKIMEFEDKMEEGRNEGLFFKSLGKKTSIDEAKVKEEVEKVKDGRKTRKNVYLFFIGLLTYGIVGSISSTTDWRKIAVLGVILVALFSQFIYEQNKDNNENDE